MVLKKCNCIIGISIFNWGNVENISQYVKPIKINDFSILMDPIGHTIYRFNYCPICGQKIDWYGIKNYIIHYEDNLYKNFNL